MRLQKVKYTFLLPILLPVVLSAQSKSEELIEWSANRRLTWNDYKAKPEPGSGAAASTTTYLGIEYDFSGGGFSFKISSSFSRDRSWGQNKSEYILGHEQGHFDIAEIFARRLNKEMSEYEYNQTSYPQDLKKIYEEVMKDKEDMQNEYDDETDHSINRVKQAEWLKKIEKMLEELKKYSDYH